MSQAKQPAATHISYISYEKDQLQPKNDEEMLALLDDLEEHDRPCQVYYPAGYLNTQVLQGLSDRGFFHTTVTPDYEIFERPSGPVLSALVSKQGGMSQEGGGRPSKGGRIEAPSKFSGVQGGCNGGGGNGDKGPQGGVQALLLSARDQEQLQQVSLELEGSASDFKLAWSFANKFSAGLLVSAHLSAKGDLCLVVERGHFQVTVAERYSVQVQAVDIVVTADKPYMSQLTIPALEKNAGTPLTHASLPKERRHLVSTKATSGEAGGPEQVAVLTKISGKPVMPVEKGTMRSATLSIQSSLQAAALTGRLSDLSIVHLDTPHTPRKLAIHCPKPLLNDVTFRVSVRMRAQFTRQLLDSQSYEKKMTSINEGDMKDCLLAAAKMRVHVNQGSVSKGAPQSAIPFDLLTPTSK